MNRNERRCTRPVNITTLSVEKTQKACKAVCIKDMIIRLLTHSVTIPQLDLYLQCTNDSFSLTLFIPLDNHFSIPLTLTFSHSPTLLHPVAPIQSPPSQPQHSDLAPAVSHWRVRDANETTRPFDWIMQGNPGETPPILYVHRKT